MERITITNLRRTVESLNSLIGKPGYFTIGCAYGGYRIESHNGSRDVSPRGTARETQEWLFVFKAGFCFAVDANNPHPQPRYIAPGLEVMLNEASIAASYYASTQGQHSTDGGVEDTQRAYVATRDAVRFARVLEGGK